MKHQNFAVALLAAGTLVAGAGPAVAAPPDCVSGSGSVLFVVGENQDFGDLVVSAHRDSASEPTEGTGQIRITYAGQTTSGTVTCLASRGDDYAGATGTLDEAVDGLQYLDVKIIDGGPNQPDRVRVTLLSELPESCKGGTREDVRETAQRGNFVVGAGAL
jgi:hypothetical protein